MLIFHFTSVGELDLKLEQDKSSKSEITSTFFKRPDNFMRIFVKVIQTTSEKI